MGCCSESGGKKAGGGCCGDRPFPWFSALTDPTVARLFFRRFWRELLIGAGAGCLASLALLGAGDGLLGGLGVALRGPMLHFHAAAVLPAALLGGLLLALGLAGKGGRIGVPVWVVVIALLGGVGNGLLEVGDPGRGWLSAFLEEGGLASLLAFGILLLPVLAAARWLLGLALSAPRAAGCQGQEAP